MLRPFTVAIALMVASQAVAEECGTNKNGQAIVCPKGVCCPTTGTWTCAPLGSTCCYEANRVGLGLYCDAKSTCWDKENCVDDSLKTFPATPGAPAGQTAALSSKSIVGTVYEGVPTATAKPTGTIIGTVFGDASTATGKPQVPTKPNAGAGLHGAEWNAIWAMAIALIGGVLLVAA